MREILYVSYDGVLEPLGESQVLSYLLELACDHRITLLSYEKHRDWQEAASRKRLVRRLRAAGIRWVPLRYHQRPSLPATAWDIAAGVAAGALACWTRRAQIVHARGYVSGVIGLCVARLSGAKLVFDMRGFWADEKVDAGQWRAASLRYRLAKRWERRLLHGADAIVSLTAEGVRALPAVGGVVKPSTLVEVIPTCADTARFAPGAEDLALRERLGLRHRMVIGSVGTLSNWYLREPTLRYLALLSTRLDAAVLLVTRDNHARLRQEARAAGIPEDRLVLARAPFSEMPAHLRLMDLGVFFIKPSFSKRASAPTKLAEFLATGVPVVINDGVGDSGTIVREDRVGVVLERLDPAALSGSLEPVWRLLADPDCSQRCRRSAEARFNLSDGVRKYRELYQQMASRR